MPEPNPTYTFDEFGAQLGSGPWVELTIGGAPFQVSGSSPTFITYRLSTDEVPQMYSSYIGGPSRTVYPNAIINQALLSLVWDPRDADQVVDVSIAADPSGEFSALPPNARRLIKVGEIHLVGPEATFQIDDTPSLLSGVNLVRTNGEWDGALRFVMHNFEPTSGSNPRTNGAGSGIAVTQQSADTGLVGIEYIRGREGSGVVRDYKTGEEIARDLAVVDDLTGQLVAPENVDPPDNRKRERSNG